MDFGVPYTDLANEARALERPLAAAFERVLHSGRYILGPELAAFKAVFAAFCGTRYAIGMASGTDALVVAFRALELPPQAEVVTVPNSFIATAAAIVRAGAKRMFADVGEDGNIDPGSFEAAITPRTRAVVPVHLAGRSAHMRDILPIAERRGILVIEDATQAIGARLDELQAALLRVQLPLLEEKTEARRPVAKRYNEMLAPYGEVPLKKAGEYYVYQTYIFRCDRRDVLQRHLRDNGIEAIVHYRTLIHEQPAASSMGCAADLLPRARRHAGRILSLPIYPGLAQARQDTVASLIGEFFLRAA